MLDTSAKQPSNRSFGIFFSSILFIACLLSFVKQSNFTFFIFSIATISLVITLIKPIFFLPLKRFWLKLGSVIQSIMTPLILGIIFYLVIFPTALLMRLFGKRPLSLKACAKQHSYWIERSKLEPQDDMRNQF